MHRPRKVAIALESASNGWDGPEAKRAGHQSTAHAVSLLLRPDDELHLVSVKNKVPSQVSMPSVLSPADREIFCPADTLKDEADRVEHMLQHAAHSVIFNNYHPSIHAIDPVGGVREALVAFCTQNDIELLLMGPVRETTGASGLLRSLLGFGSVSEYTLHNLNVPIAIFHESNMGALDAVNGNVLVCVDSLNDHEGTQSLVEWVVGNVNKERTHIHIVSCALRAPYDIVDEECACAIGEIHQEEQELDKQMVALAEDAVSVAKDIASTLGANHIRTEVLQADGNDAGEVAKVLAGYAAGAGFDLICLGKRDQSAVTRTLNHWLGDGSVSDLMTKETLGGSVVVVVPNVTDS